MAEGPPNIVLIKLDDIRRGQEALAAKVGTIATSMVSMVKRLHDLDRKIDDLGAGTRLIAVAVDHHSHRLDHVDSRLDRIENKLGLTHA
jgi:predicted RNA methylase